MLDITAAAGGETEKLTADVVLVAVGRKPHTEGLALEDIGVNIDERGRIPVDEDFETNVPGIFAIGDVIPGPMLAHKAEEDGVAAVEIMAGLAGHVDYDVVPGVVYTDPEIATIGKTEKTLIPLVSIIARCLPASGQQPRPCHEHHRRLCQNSCRCSN